MVKDYIHEEMDVSLLFLDNLKAIEIWQFCNDVKECLATWAKSERVSFRHEQSPPLVMYNLVLSDGGTHHPWRIVQTKTSEAEAKSRLAQLAGGESVDRVMRKHKLRSDVRIAYPISPEELISGRLFTFLPLPSKTGFPVHIHALFALTSSRQSLRNRQETGIVPGSDNEYAQSNTSVKSS